MTMIITASIDNEEHILTVNPDEDFVKILENTLGTIHDCTFSVNGETIVSVKDLPYKISHNTKIEVKRYRTRGTYTSFAPTGSSLIIKSQKNPTRPVINIETVHISCSSDSYNENEDMAGLIIYSFDNKQFFELNGRRCRAGYILIKATKNIEHAKSNQGAVHGNLFKWFFGIEPDNRFVGAGFSLQDKKVKFNSGVFNSRNDDYHDEERSMSRDEISLIMYAVEELFKNGKWETNPTLSLSNMHTSGYNVGDFLPLQNRPRSTINKDTS